MQINLTGHHVEITSSLKEYVNTKVNKLERHFDRINNIRVVLTVEKSIQTAEATLLLTGSEVFASADNEDMYTAIDSLIDKLDKQLLKYKDKHNQH
ncbi:MAG: putative sigma-54 modulation protein [Alteromonadaceae bacterium]|jgi:putative sigma-54 modulation protein|tara:strand:- start:4 stop:291 length:288 start_codon:yes stop_codon:yes gene_type:complete